MEAALRKGRALPTWYLDEPPSHPMDQFYMSSFWALCTERNYEYGPIPWSRIYEYGYKLGLDADIIASFVALIRAMDATWRKWTGEELDRQRKQKT